ncbi:MAG: thiamine-phosphate kinase [Bacteroidota bacterium]
MQETSFTPIDQLGEFGLIDRMTAILETPTDEDVIVGISDDAAVYRIDEDRAHVVTTDALIEGVHFDRLFMPMEHLGWKSMAVNISDIIAMNAAPRFATIAVGLPNNFSVEMVEAFYRGVKRACSAYDVTVLGGDTVAARHLTISVTVIGESLVKDIVFRRGAQPGDLLCVTGDLGGAYAGLKVLLQQRQKMKEEGVEYVPDLASYEYVIQRQLQPRPRFDVINDWTIRGFRPNALIDISDGLASEMHHLCSQSQSGALLHAAAIPISFETRDAADDFEEDVDAWALFGGEDYELLFAASREELSRLDETTFNVVGEFTEASFGVQVQTPDGHTIPLSPGGYTHFTPGSEDEGAE